MTNTQFKILFDDIESQIAASGRRDRDVLRQHLRTLQQKAASQGYRGYHPGSRPEQDRIDDDVEAQFDNLPI
ncbi:MULTISPECIES: hypothetical protein [unclassified Marinovum]